MGKLTALTISKLNETGRLSDGNGLYLLARYGSDGSLNRSWLVRYRGKLGTWRETGIGRFPDISLAQARIRASAIRLRAQKGDDVIAAREAEKAAAARESIASNQAIGDAVGETPTFKECAEAYVAAHESTWTNSKHMWQWTHTLRTKVYPGIGQVPIKEIGKQHVLSVLDPIWRKTPETANRIRGRIELVLHWAKARGLRDGDNPAAWRGNLQFALPSPRKISPTKHHPAMAVAELPSFMAELIAIDQMSAKALCFAILTAARTNEVLQAKWDEIDLAGATWTLPSSRTKARRQHRVPLSAQALSVLKAATAVREGDYVFAGARYRRPLSNMSMLMLMRRLGRSDLTTHGFRSTFRDWCAEHTNFPREVAEAALAHIVGDKVEAAYLRTEFIEKRRALMAAWGEFVSPLSSRAKG